MGSVVRTHPGSPITSGRYCSLDRPWRGRRSVAKVLAELIRLVGRAVFGVGDRDAEALLAALGDVQRLGRVVALVGQSAVQRSDVDPESHLNLPRASDRTSRRDERG